VEKDPNAVKKLSKETKKVLKKAKNTQKEKPVEKSLFE